MYSKLIKDIVTNGLSEYAKGNELLAIEESLKLLEQYNIDSGNEFCVDPIVTLDDFIKELNILITYQDFNTFHAVLTETLKQNKN